MFNQKKIMDSQRIIEDHYEKINGRIDYQKLIVGKTYFVQTNRGICEVLVTRIENHKVTDIENKVFDYEKEKYMPGCYYLDQEWIITVYFNQDHSRKFYSSMDCYWLFHKRRNINHTGFYKTEEACLKAFTQRKAQVLNKETIKEIKLKFDC